MFLAGIKKPALAYAKSGYKIPSLASIYKAPCKLSSNQRLISLYVLYFDSQVKKYIHSTGFNHED